MGKGFLDALGSQHHYSAGSQDVNNRFVASALLYGSPLVVPIPDLHRTELLLYGRGEPARLARQCCRRRASRAAHEIGRVVVVDPRRTETARQFEHVPVRPDSDAWLLLSMLT